MPRPIRAAISAAAMKRNLEVARRHAGGAELWAVIKANAYGHGIERAVRAFAAADGFALLDLADASRLRRSGVRLPILLLEGFFQPEDLASVCGLELTPVVHSPQQVAVLTSVALAKPIDVYLKVNSGMNRLGLNSADLGAAFDALRSRPGVRSVTLMTHFADADGDEGVAGQLERFEQMTGGIDAPRCLANSAALLRYPRTRADWVRPGIMLYGCSPFPEVAASELGLAPAMTLASEIISVQRLNPGDRVGYGFRHSARAPTTIGVVACGYGDGYPRHAPDGTPVLVDGQRAGTAGRVSMDLLCVDIGAIPGAGVGTPVTLWGDGLSADEVAAAAGTVSYQLLCGLAARVPVVELD
ncbi:MAG: alanine racemase [Betaproteobacteria bacterium RIFCSPLOWO2_02_FULL_66_14]|nr:MAG: alanine racemase [Betaproteobacteria bacterium RIFCSPLOWO2_02_FULL_66_14]